MATLTDRPGPKVWPRSTENACHHLPFCPTCSASLPVDTTQDAGSRIVVADVDLAVLGPYTTGGVDATPLLECYGFNSISFVRLWMNGSCKTCEPPSKESIAPYGLGFITEDPRCPLVCAVTPDGEVPDGETLTGMVCLEMHGCDATTKKRSKRMDYRRHRERR